MWNINPRFFFSRNVPVTVIALGLPPPQTLRSAKQGRALSTCDWQRARSAKDHGREREREWRSDVSRLFLFPLSFARALVPRKKERRLGTRQMRSRIRILKAFSSEIKSHRRFYLSTRSCYGISVFYNLLWFCFIIATVRVTFHFQFHPSGKV